MPPKIQIATQKIRHRAEVLAVEALDDLVGEVIQANKFGVSRAFLDWVNVNATDFVVDRLKKSATKDYLQAAIDSENARTTMRQLVDGWVMPHIHQQFKSLTSCREEFQESVSASLGMQTIDFVI
jgi:hypothetical protein